MTKTKKITSTDIAKMLKTSQPSISRAFMDNTPLTLSKRINILDFCVKHNYKKPQAIKILAEINPIKIAFILSELHNPFFSSLLNSFSEAISKHEDHHLEIHIVQNQSAEDLRKLVKSLKLRNTDFIITASLLVDSELPNLSKEVGIPLIAINRSIPDHHISYITADNFHNAYKIGEIIHNKGHSNIAFIADDKNIGSIKDRMAGLSKYLSENNLPKLHIITCNTSYEGAYQQVKNQYQTLIKKNITCIVGGNDIMAIGGMDALRHEHNVNIPDDIAFIGFDDIPMASWKPYQLTTVRQRIRLMSKEAIEIMKIIKEEGMSGLTRQSQGKIITRKTL